VGGRNQIIPNSVCVTQELRAQADVVARKRHQKRMDELHSPDLVTMVSACSCCCHTFPCWIVRLLLSSPVHIHMALT